MSKEKSTPTAEVIGPMSIHVELDPVARLRELPVVPSRSVPAVSPQWKPIPHGIKQGFAKPADTQHAELKEALGEIVARREHLAGDFGRQAPDARIAEQALAQWDEIEAGRTRARALLAFYEDQHDLLMHDGMSLVMKTNRQIRNLAEDEPTIVSHYPKTVALAAQRSAAISEGMAARLAEEKKVKTEKEEPGTAPA